MSNKPFKRPRPASLPSAIKQAVQRATATEPKYVVTAISASVDSAGPIVTPITLVAEGTGTDERIGREIEVEYVSMRVRIAGPSSQAADSSVYVRCIVAQDRDARGATPATVNLYPTSTPSVTDHRRMEPRDRQRWLILMDETYLVAASDETAFTVPVFNNAKSAVAGNTREVYVHKMMKPVQKKMGFVGDTAAAASQGAGAIYLFTVTNASSGEDITVTGEALMKYRG